MSHVDRPATNVLSLFSGGGGLDLGVELAVPGARAVCFVEREAYACAVLATRMEEGSLAAAPIWSDVTTFDGRPWRGVVDLIAGGFPCQDISNAGLRAGIGGERSGLWSEFARIIREVEPGSVFVENVAALASRGLDVVLGDLAELGFHAEWDVFRADEVGAPHRRERLFILAHSERDGLQGRGAPHDDDGRDAPGHDADRRHAAVSDPGSERLEGIESAGAAARATRRGDRASFPPSPSDAEGWRDWPGAQPAIRRGSDGLADRVERLRLLGNGVVPQCAALAYRVLSERLAGGR